MTWSSPIWVYLWLAGMAGGAYLAAFLAQRFGREDRQLLQMATYLGIPMAVIGVLLLVVDLGSPLRFWHLFLRFKVMSAMSMGTWILLAWVGIAIIMTVLWWAERFLTAEESRGMRKLTERMSKVNVVLAALLIAYTGVLLAASNQPLWSSTVLLPALFVASAVSTGTAVLVATALVATSGMTELKLAINQILGSKEWSIPNRTVARLAEADAIVVIIELVALIAFVISLATSGTPGAAEALHLLLAGALAIPFWAGVVVLALLLPMVLDFANWAKGIETRSVRRAVMLSSASVILGGLVLRAVIVLGGQLG